MTGIMAIIVALVLLMVLAYRGLSLLILAPLLAALVAIVSVDTPLLASYTQVFMGAAGNFIVSFFPLFLLGAIFGKLMEDSGSAEVTLPPAERDLPPLPLALLPQAPRGAHHHPGQRRQRLAVADLQHRQPGRLRFGDRLARGLRGDQPLGDLGGRRQPSDLPGHRGQPAGGHDRLGLRRHEHRPGHAGRHLPGHGPGLSGYRRGGRGDPDPLAGAADRPGHPGRLVLRRRARQPPRSDEAMGRAPRRPEAALPAP